MMQRLGGTMILGGLFVMQFTFVVDGGERALIMDATRGLRPHVYGEGMHFRLPVIHQIKTFQVRSQPTMIPSSTGTRDLQTVDIALRILYRPREEKLHQILINNGQDYDKRILPSIGNEVLKSVVAQYNAEQLISERQMVSNQIRDQLGEKASEFGIILDDVSITDLQFTKEFMEAIEAKQVAQQQAERAKYIVMQREEEMKAAIIEAEGQAEAAKLVSDAICKFGPGVVAMRKIEAAAHIADVLRASPNVTFLSGNTVNMLNLGGGSL